MGFRTELSNQSPVKKVKKPNRDFFYVRRFHVFSVATCNGLALVCFCKSSQFTVGASSCIEIYVEIDTEKTFVNMSSELEADGKEAVIRIRPSNP